LLVVFAASFLGAFEITLPSAWANRMDANADKGGKVGLFFMAATLALVSFSCTGPLIGTLLVEAASMGNYLSPAVGMLGFAMALALPFTLFAMFPSWLTLKFLSNVDLAYHWEWFDREVFLVLWIIIFGMLGFYLLGKIKLPHDTEMKHIGIVRLFTAIVTLAFALYLVPGLWGAPLKVISAFLPPQTTQDFDLYTATMTGNTTGMNSQANVSRRKYDDIFHAPLGLQPFFDYEEGMAYAKKARKPVMIDFTGHACVNCRKMETTVWPDARVLSSLREDYVLIQLYVDDKTSLPDSEQFVSSYSGKKITTIGKKWSDFQASAFNTNSQPWYVLLDNEGKQLIESQGADYDVERFVDFLSRGKTSFNSHLP